MTGKSDIGKNIRYLRKIRGMSMRQVCDRLSESSGRIVTSQTIRAWQIGERSVPADVLVDLSEVLRCSISSFYYIDRGPNDNIERLHEEVDSLSPREQEILLYLATEWSGDVHTLIEFCALYANLLPGEREDIAGMGIHQFESRSGSDVLGTTGIRVNLNAIIRGWRLLLKG